MTAEPLTAPRSGAPAPAAEVPESPFPVRRGQESGFPELGGGAGSGDPGPVDAALRVWFGSWCRPPGDVEDVALLAAVGRVVARPLAARVANPAHDLAAMDGVAVTAADVAAVCTVLPAGGFDVVDTGDPLPPGRDAVVPRELLLPAPPGGVGVAGPVVAGKHVRRAGEDVAAGQPLLPAGHRVRPVDAAVLASAGYAEVPVRRPPRVAVVPTGDEIRPAGTVPARGEIVDSNSVLIAARLAELGADVEVAPIVPDDPDRLAAVLCALADRADLVLVIAGSSAGRDDHTAAVVGAVGRVVVHHLPLRPGHPVLLGAVRGTAVIGVPGYPVAAARVTELFAVPALDRLLGRSPTPPRMVPAVLASDICSAPGSDEQVPVRLVAGHAEPLPRGAGTLTSLLHADGLLRMPVGCAGRQAGDTVLVEPREGAPR
jgi:putative molybdopterin biosynthesis protein